MTREIAYELLSRVQTEDAYANLLLPKLLTRYKVDSRDAGFIQELSFGVLRNRLLYESVFESASGRKLRDTDNATLLVILLGIHQLLEMRVANHAAINESVNLAKKVCNSGAVGFVNAVLRKVSQSDSSTWKRRLTQDLTGSRLLSLMNSHPEWMVLALSSALKSRKLEDSLPDLLASHQTPARVSIVAFPKRCRIQDIEQAIPGTNISPIGAEIQGNPSEISELEQGLVRVQDQGSQLVTLALLEAPVQASEEGWLDMCAGPGGKAALLAATAEDRKVPFTCNEVLPHRAELVKRAVAPFRGVKVTTSDGRELSSSSTRYSRILLDAPCTGLGALRRRPEARWRKKPEDLKDLTKLQRELLISAWKMLSPGGVLAYVTCSPHLSETTAQVAWFEAQFEHSVELLNSNDILNGINKDLMLDASFKTTQLWPHIHRTDGMFLVLFRKRLDS